MPSSSKVRNFCSSFFAVSNASTFLFSSFPEEGRTPNGTRWRIELQAFKTPNLQVVSVYKSPSASNSRLFEHFRRAIFPVLDVDSPILVVGDFNIDLKSGSAAAGTLINLMQEIGLSSILHPQASTTNHNTQLDLAFTNVQQPPPQVHIYESATSYHKPLMVAI